LDREELTGAEDFNFDEILKLLDESPSEAQLDNLRDSSDYNVEVQESAGNVSPESIAMPLHEAEPPASETNIQKDASAQQGKEAEKKLTFGETVVMYLHDLVYLLAFVVVLLSLCLRMVIVDGDSMYNTLVDGDYLLLVSNVLYREPKAGDIIVASKATFRNGSPIVKRVIATEGQLVDIDFATGTVYVDGNALEEDYIYSLTTNPEGMNFPLVVADGCIFVMGDNRGRSMDSRDPEIGLIDVREVTGKAIFLLVPGDNNGEGPRDFSRFGVIS
jgi:signal peptidase I